MQYLLENVMPVGSPWGGTENIEYLSCFSSMLLHLEDYDGTRNFMQKMHEDTYHLYLTISGLGLSSLFNESFTPITRGVLVDQRFEEVVHSTMEYAGCLYRVYEHTQPTQAQEQIVEALKKNIAPLLYDARTSQWRIVTGYDTDTGALMGYDGRNTQWAVRQPQPDFYLDNGMFVLKKWQDSYTHLIAVYDKQRRPGPYPHLLNRLISVLEKQIGSDAPLLHRLGDPEYFHHVSDADLEVFYEYLYLHIGYYADARKFAADAFRNAPHTLHELHNGYVYNCMKAAARQLQKSHEIAIEAWDAMNVLADGTCHIQENAGKLRNVQTRIGITRFLQKIALNDQLAMLELKSSVKILSSKPRHTWPCLT